MSTLEDITVGASVKGIRPGNTVSIISATWHGSDTLDVVYKDESGNLGSEILFRDAESRIEVSEQTRPWSFDAPPDKFLLAVEAYRIQLAALFDPVLAVHTSLVEPLPHQILAVYESMLPRQPLRYLLADDPGAGKTIMAGLLIKELIVRGDLDRCLIVCPGSLAEQWQDELTEKFNLDFSIATNDKIEAARTGNWFNEADHVIARLDKLARNEDIQEMLKTCEWDLIIVDEAHKMSASYFGSEATYTKRYRLGQLISATTRHFLLMSATPHNGKEEDFQLFSSLLDGDRFEGRFRDGVHMADSSDLMRRLSKEQLLRFDGTPLFPERRAYVVHYELSEDESALYAAVTDYVRNEFNRAQELEDGGRKGTVGFALMVLQRRLASSPQAIYQSLRRRRERLESQLREMQELSRGSTRSFFQKYELPSLSEDDVEEIDDLPDNERVELEEQVVDGATTARTIHELQAEIEILCRLEEMADVVRKSGRDRKWAELSNLLQDNPEMFDTSGQRRKLVIFTEHRDTLDYLTRKIQTLLGKPDALVTISGGMGREIRRNAEEAFRNDPGVEILLATDAAGEGINLQRAHLMVNYDLPWNPNRLEQRFGRIHRIGQEEVCHLWNLVAQNTREGDVYERLLQKLEVAREALGGSVFDVLGQVFEGRDLRDLLMEAVRYGDRPETKARLFERVDNAASQERVRSLIESEALSKDSMDSRRVQQVREEMERRELRRLQPRYIQQFFVAAFGALGGRIARREKGLFEITHVPAIVRSRDRQMGTRAPVLSRYERVTFEKDLASSKAAFICPGHPLLDATLSVTSEQNRSLLRHGTVLIDPTDEGIEPYSLVALDHVMRDNDAVADGDGRVVSREVQFVKIYRSGEVVGAGFAPHIDYRTPDEHECSLVADMLDAEWLTGGLEGTARGYALEYLVPPHRHRIEKDREEYLNRARQAERQRQRQEINYWDSRAQELKLKEEAGQKTRLSSLQSQRRADELQTRLDSRLRQIDRQLQLSTGSPNAQAGAFVVPQGLLNQLQGVDEPEFEQISIANRRRIDQLAVAAVMAAERQLGREPVEMPHNNPGFDIESYKLDDQGRRTGEIVFIEVKGKMVGRETVTVSANQINFAYNKPDQFVLAVVSIENDQAKEPHYVRRPFELVAPDQVASMSFKLSDLLARANVPS